MTPGVFVRVAAAASGFDRWTLAVSVPRDALPGMRWCIRWVRKRRRFSDHVVQCEYYGAASEQEVRHAGITPEALEQIRRAHGIDPHLWRDLRTEPKSAPRAEFANGSDGRSDPDPSASGMS